MRTFRRLTSIWLLLILGTVLGAEAIGYLDSHGVPCSEITMPHDQAANEGAQDPHANLDGNAGIHCSHDHSEGPASKCSDPCHAGQAHFGHSLYNASKAQLCFLLASSLEILNSHSQLAPAGPVLEGLRRPPRLA